MARSTNTALARARKDADEAKKALAEAEKSRRSTDARQWLELGMRKLAEAMAGVKEVQDRLGAVEDRHGAVALTSRSEEPA